MERPFWVFGYGSLIWNPGFVFAERQRATLSGWRRSFCMHSVQYRGTPEAPGLVLALDAEDRACCNGVAYRIGDDLAEPTLAYLRERELISSAYDEAWLPVWLEERREVTAMTFVINHAHEQYAGPLSLDDQAQVIARSEGIRGPNADYLYATAAHLAELGISDADLDALTLRVRQCRGE
jgi:cation transport protein ChaC